MSIVDTAYKEPVAKDYDDQRFNSPGGRAIHAVEMKILRKAMQDAGLSSGDTVAEVGCGTGRVLADIAAEGFKVTGVEPSESMMGKAKERFADDGIDGEFLLGTTSEIPCDSDRFDFVYTVRVLNQTESREYALSSVKELLRAAKPGSAVLLEFMNYHRRGFDRRKFRLGNIKHDRGDSKNVRLTPAEVEEEVKKSGGEIVWTRGIFFLGMTSYYSVPGWLTGAVGAADGILSKLLPRLCSRSYVLARKAG